ncbi:MAG: metallophosphoesterase [Chloroflexota bacterium]
MSYKILHFSDLHLDASFAGQGFPVEYGNARRLDLRAALTRILSKARELKVNAITIGGDLFVQSYLLPETADFIQQQLALLAPIRVIIAPGGQDPYTNESPYSRIDWPDNVDIFYQAKLSHLELAPDIHLWGACNPPARGQKLLNDFQPAKGNNFILLHALRGTGNSEIHNIDIDEIKKVGFRLALLGGEHLAEISSTEKPFLVYPGSPEPLSPGEEKGHHQIALIEVDGENVNVQSLTLRQWFHHAIDVDISTCISNAEAALEIDAALKTELTKTTNSAITVILKGKPNFDLSISSIRQHIQIPAFFRLEDHFTLNHDLKQIALEQTVRGLLVQRFLARIKNTANESERQQQLTALHFALQAFDGKQVNLYETKEN